VSFLKMMQYHKIMPVVVFDGGRLPSKAATEDDRRQYEEGEREGEVLIDNTERES